MRNSSSRQDRIEPVQLAGTELTEREPARGLDSVRPLTAREIVTIDLEDKLRALRARLDEF